MLSYSKEFAKLQQDAEINSAILALFEMPANELSDKMQEQLGHFRYPDRTWKPQGELPARHFFRTFFLAEIKEWIKINWEINHFLID